MRLTPKTMAALLSISLGKGRPAFMLFSGEWLECDDGIVRPVIRGEVLTGKETWLPVPFLVDTAADRTVFSASILEQLQLQPIVSPTDLGGVGGVATSITV